MRQWRERSIAMSVNRIAEVPNVVNVVETPKLTADFVGRLCNVLSSEGKVKIVQWLAQGKSVKPITLEALTGETLGVINGLLKTLEQMGIVVKKYPKKRADEESRGRPAPIFYLRHPYPPILVDMLYHLEPVKPTDIPDEEEDADDAPELLDAKKVKETPAPDIEPEKRIVDAKGAPVGSNGVKISVA